MSQEDANKLSHVEASNSSAGAIAPAEPEDNLPVTRCVYPQQTAALRWLREDFAGDLAGCLGRLVRSQMHLQFVGATVQSKSAFLDSIEEPSCCYRLELRQESAAGPSGNTPVEGSALPGGGASRVWVELTPPIAFPILNCLLGGSSDDAFLPRRPLTTIERRLLIRVVELVGTSFSRAWPGQDKPAFTAGPLDIESVAKTGSHDLALTASFDLGIDRQAGVLRLCMDGRFMPAIASPVRPTGRAEGPLEISASLVELPISPDEMSALAVGDILMTDSAADGEVIIRIAGIPKFVGKLGIFNGRRAVTIVRKVN